jgi:aspartyl-tRNA(Asn)/glutamyl-tRNA(Gln) amidotransferase subunit A
MEPMPDAEPAGLQTPTSRRRFLAVAAASAGGVAVATPAGARPRVAPAHGQPGAAAVERQGKPLADHGVLELAALLQAGRTSPAEVLAAHQERIAKRNGPVSFDGSPTTVNAFVRRYDDVAGRLAASASARLARRGHRAPWLTGVPVGLKDLYAVRGLGLTASSRILEGNVATGDSEVWKRLSAAGMVLMGHTHTDEFAFLAVTPQCGNPWDTGRITGGSSGGSAAALAARMLPAATGSDTLGSLRIPAAFCGVSSIKPTFGLVSAAGVIPLAWALDHCGPLARSVADCSLMLSAMAGRDPNDPSTDVGARPPARYPLSARRGSRPLTGTRIGIPSSLGGTPQAGPAEIYGRTQAELRGLGAALIAVDEPASPFTASTDPLAFYTDALDYHQPWFPSRAASYRPPAMQMLTLIRGMNLSALAYLDLHRRRAAFQAQYRRFLADQRLDAVALPVSLGDPPRRDDPSLQSPASNPENAQLLTFPYSYLGFPVVTVPGGASSASGLPVGIQLVGAPFTESRLIQIAIDLQAHHPHFEEQPRPA